MSTPIFYTVAEHLPALICPFCHRGFYPGERVRKEHRNAEPEHAECADLRAWQETRRKAATR